MENNITKNGFTYTYSAKEQEEIKRIRQKYEQQEMNKMDQLRKLDASVNSKAVSCSLALGIIGTLIMGSGMSLAMTNLGAALGINGNVSLIIGIIIGVLGMIVIGIAYPVYSRILKKERAKAAPEIIRLTEELMK